MPPLPILTASNKAIYPAWHAYIERHYHQSIEGGVTVDLNTFSFFYYDDGSLEGNDPIATLLTTPCVRVCTLRAWPDREAAYEGTLFVGSNGPEALMVDGRRIGFHVQRTPIAKLAARHCDSLEVMHVRTDWLGGEHGLSWFFHTVGSGVFLDCHRLPASGTIEVYKGRRAWEDQHPEDGDDDNWIADSSDILLPRMEWHGVSMYVFTDATFKFFGDPGRQSRTEIIVRHKNRDSSDQWSAQLSCLNADPKIAMPLKTGLHATLACQCHRAGYINCDDTPFSR